MLKKKNIAMVMAAATVATTVAPAFAAKLDTETVTDEAKLIAEVQEKLNTRYTNSREDGENGRATEDFQNSVYKITANGTTVIENVSQLRTLIENNKVDGVALTLSIVDKGHKVLSNGDIVATEENQHVKYTPAELAGLTFANANIATVAHATSSATITLTNTDVDPIELTTDDYKLDLTQPVDKDGNKVSADANAEVGKKVVGFKTLETGKVVENDIPSEEIAKYEFHGNGTTTEKDASAYITDGIYTVEGEDLVNTIVKARNNSNTTEYTANGKTYVVTIDANTVSAIEVVKAGGYKLTVNFTVKEKNAASSVKATNVTIVIKSNTERELKDLRTALLGTTEVTANSGKYTILAGQDRFSTAVEISKEGYVKYNESATASKDKAGAVVLVGEDAIVDGLAAAPLAKQKKAPLLLTKKNSISADTMTEIKRVVDEKATIYLVGGTNVISKDVEAQLIKEMNANIVRLAGDDRYATSTEIADEMMKTAGTTAADAFVVGGDGEADAMSIASIASAKTAGNAVAPIIVTPAKGLTKDAKNFFEKHHTTTVGVIGGTSKVSTQVLRDLQEANVTSTTRTSGDDRHETNANVIKNYSSVLSTGNVYVAKDGYAEGNGKLIDALSVAALAGKNAAPIVLATNDLTKDQSNAVSGIVKANGKLSKVGNGVSSTVMSKLVNLLGLNK
ncbi:cell wall-binding repeat-containing protein [Romboutsia maritimum]|uniref:Cell wall-binding repeat-containing protein n=1 Tax=Romboutsia maritimum TaxID=2020948 RepID=A0A371IS28_9FIRM|nr:cell wall-binding repeat-containing protein [Romboutsia maritimum]RDY23281.1 cell wall-binding repeat-containing protein [Romboutsia maritimum]